MKKQIKKDQELESKSIIEFETNAGVTLKMIKRNNKYNILVSDEKKKIKNKKIFDSLDTEISTKQFLTYCNYFTKHIND